ncbi:DUF4129 domain-containing protein [Cellulomonas hominis]
MRLPLLGRIPVDVPVVPDADRARGWLEQELADPVYHRGPSLLQRLLDWLGSLFDGFDGVDVDTRLLVAIGVLVAVVVVGLGLWYAGPVRRARRSRGPGAVLGPGEVRTADDLRRAADDAAAAGRWEQAVADRFRAVVRALEERTVLDERPGRTAHEAVEAARARLPGAADDLRRAGRLFDGVVYGDARASAADDAALRDLDRRVAQSRPDTALPVATESWAGVR